MNLHVLMINNASLYLTAHFTKHRYTSSTNNVQDFRQIVVQLRKYLKLVFSRCSSTPTLRSVWKLRWSL